jgi:hypothetical protein
VGHKGPCPLTAPCLSVLWLSVGLRGVVDVPPAAWVAMPDLDRTALPSGGDLACRIGGLRKEGRQSYVLALLQCVLRSILPSARGQEGIDALNNAMKDTDAALKPGCRAGWDRRGPIHCSLPRACLFACAMMQTPRRLGLASGPSQRGWISCSGIS